MSIRNPIASAATLLFLAFPLRYSLGQDPRFELTPSRLTAPSVGTLDLPDSGRSDRKSVV